MEDGGDDDDLALIKASQSVLDDLHKSLPRLLHKRPQDGKPLSPHSCAQQKSLDHVIKLIEPFQGDPQLLDTSLKTIVPQLSSVLVQSLAKDTKVKEGHVSIIHAVSVILYTLCKIRGRKVISGLLPNEPQHLELVVSALGRTASDQQQWQVEFTLLLWLGHLLLAPFDLTSISSIGSATLPGGLKLPHETPYLAQQSISLCLTLLSRAAISQTVAALALARLATRPDMQRLSIAEHLLDYLLPQLESVTSLEQIHQQLGILRFLAALSKSGEADQLFRRIFASCEAIVAADDHPLASDAIGRKLTLKTMATIMMTVIRSSSSSDIAVSLLAEGALESAIQYQLQCLADPESLVRNAAAKSMSNVISALDPDMRRDILEAVLADLQNSGNHSKTANAYLWQGHVLTLSYALFRRCVPQDLVSQLIDILLIGLSFQQRTMTGSITGANVRDAANFGLWSVARRCTTTELGGSQTKGSQSSFITIALALVQAACLDPDGNVRRGSSAALQELVGRHPDTVPEGISLVQIVDFVAVGLRQRALLVVTAEAAALDDLYWQSLCKGLMGWRGIESSDVSSRAAAATSLMNRIYARNNSDQYLQIEQLIIALDHTEPNDAERFHGIVLCLASWIDHLTRTHNLAAPSTMQPDHLWSAVNKMGCFVKAFALRSLRSELTAAIAKLMVAYIVHQTAVQRPLSTGTIEILEDFIPQLLVRTEATLRLETISLVRALSLARPTLPLLSVHELGTQLAVDITKPTQYGAGRVFAVAASIEHADQHDQTRLLEILVTVCTSHYVDWRLIGFKALKTVFSNDRFEVEHLRTICEVVSSGLRDYTIDQRGDIGSQVRLQAIDCAYLLVSYAIETKYDEILRPIWSNIFRLSLEKLNRVREAAARCRAAVPGIDESDLQTDICDSTEYFSTALEPVWHLESPAWLRYALLEGLISCAGTSAEHLLQNSRAVVCNQMAAISTPALLAVMQDFTEVLKAVSSTSNGVAALELLAYLLQMRLLDRLVSTDFKWRGVLAVVQRAHYKTTELPRLAAAVTIYAELAAIPMIRADVLKKLISMLRTNPYPRIRAAIADTLFMITRDQDMKKHDWSKPPSQNKEHFIRLEALTV